MGVFTGVFMGVQSCVCEPALVFPSVPAQKQNKKQLLFTQMSSVGIQASWRKQVSPVCLDFHYIYGCVFPPLFLMSGQAPTPGPPVQPLNLLTPLAVRRSLITGFQEA